MKYLFENRKTFLIVAIVVIALNNLLAIAVQLFQSIRNLSGSGEFLLLLDSIFSSLSFLITTVITILVLIWLIKGKNKKKLLLLVSIDFGRAILFLIWHYIIFPNVISVTITTNVSWAYSILYYLSLIAMILVVIYWQKEQYIVSKILLAFIAIQRFVVYNINTIHALRTTEFNWNMGLSYTLGFIVMCASIIIYAYIYLYIDKEEKEEK